MPGLAIRIRPFQAGALAAALSVLLMLAPATAGAKPAWLAPVGISAPGVGTEGSHVAVDPQGEAVAVWTQTKGSEKVDIEASSRPPGGSWQAPVRLSPAAPREHPWPHEGEAQSPYVAINAKGEAVAVWRYDDGSDWLVESSTRPAGGTWGPFSIIAGGFTPSGGIREAREAGIALDPQGDAVATWTDWDTKYELEGGIAEAAVRPAGGTWQAPVQLCSWKAATSPNAAFDAQGDAVASWNAGSFEVSTRPAGGTWQAAEAIFPVQGGEGKLAVDPQGEAVAVWEHETSHGGKPYTAVIEGRSRPPGGTWQPPVTISTNTGFAGPVLAIDAQGEAIITWGSWTELGGSNTTVQSAVRPAGGSWQAPVQIAPLFVNVIKLAVDAQGDAVTVWDDYSKGEVEGAVRPADGTWQAPAGLSAGAGSQAPNVAIDGQGDAVAVWQGHLGVEAAGYDAAGPQLNGLQIPATGIAREPVTFSVSPLSVWSSLGTTTWSFGDGTSASGTSVNHAYAATGSYHVTLTSADVLGNTTSTSATIAISPAPPKPRLTSVRMTNTRFRVAKTSTAITARRTPLGTSFRFKLSTPAELRIAITSTAAGLRHGRSCLAPTSKLRHAHAKSCTRTLTVATLTRASERKGADSIPFSGRIGTRALSPRSYAAVLTATNAGGSSKPVKLSFTIVH